MQLCPILYIVQQMLQQNRLMLETDFVYLSDQLKAFYPDTFKRLTALFNELYIDWGEVYGTHSRGES